MAGYNTNVNRVSNKNPRQKIQELKDPTYGVFMAEVISAKDISRTGRLQVFIPALAQDKQTKTGYFDAVWSSPFAGSTNSKKVGTDLQSPADTQKSYGMWMVPPDIGNFVLVAFGDGNMKYPIVISCLYQDKFNHMVPGLPATGTFASDKFRLASSEKNKRSDQEEVNEATRPVQHALTEGIVKQGLVYDNVRGFSSSGARRESPSEVFGILTPGPRDPDNFNHRLGGHQFIMDDHLESRNIRIRTAQGNQVLLDDNEGILYFINKSGGVWMEFSSTGILNVYAENGINLRTRGDFNVRADKDIRLEAGNDVLIKAAGDSLPDGYQGPGAFGGAPTGNGGQVQIEAQAEARISSSASTFLTAVSGEIHLSSAGQMNLQTSDAVNVKAATDISTEAGGAFGAKAGGDVSLGAGGNINENSGGQILMNSGGAQPKAAAEALTNSAIPTTELLDNPLGDIPYDPTDNFEPMGDQGGVRTGTAANVSTIVSDFTTSEPWRGHGIARPEDSIPRATDSLKNSGGTARDANGNPLPTGSDGTLNANGDPTPADINSPAGFQSGVQYNGPNNPMYSTGMESPPNDFAYGVNKATDRAMQDITAQQALIASVPPVRTATLTPSQTQIIGSGMALDSFEQQVGQIAFDSNMNKTTLNNPAISKMQNTVNIVNAAGGTPAEKSAALASQGLDAVYRSDGVAEYTDQKSGLKLLDFSNATIDNDSNGQIVQAMYNAEKEQVASITNISVSNNQMAALTLFSLGVGFDTMQSSKVGDFVSATNGQPEHTDYAKVPNMLLEYQYAERIDDKSPYIKVESMRQRREFEAQLWQHPDYMPLPNYGNTSVPWSQQTRDLKKIRAQYLRQQKFI